MNPGEITTTEINTEIKLEVKVETESIVKVETIKNPAPSSVACSTQSQPQPAAITNNSEKSREEIKAEREAKKLAKQAKKAKSNTTGESSNIAATVAATVVPVTNTGKTNENTNNMEGAAGGEKTREQIKAEREAKKLAKQAAKVAKTGGAGATVESVAGQMAQVKIADNTTQKIATPSGPIAEGEKKKPALTKAERRAIQEAQRAAKAQAQSQKSAPVAGNKQAVKTAAAVKPATKTLPVPDKTSPTKSTANSPKRATSTSPVKSVRFNDGNVKLFSHLERPATNVNLFVNNPQIHPSIARLGEQYAKRVIVGSNARCLAFLNAVKTVIQDFETPPKKEFSRSLEALLSTSVEYLQKCRTLAVSVINAHKNLKQVLMQLPNDQPESELKEKLFIFIDTYIENQIGKAAEAINSMMQKKINNGDVILTFGCSSLISLICEVAQSRKVDFRVIVVDSRPFCEGQELLRRLTAKEIPCTYVLINAISFVMPEVTKVLLGAHALLANGYVMARTGTAQVALVARSFNVPVLVCCETHKFSERFQTDAIVYNELGNPDDIVVDDKCCLSNWQAKHKMSPLNLNYDITPPELVTAVVTEVSVLPCTSVPVILRMKPDWSIV
ncbi:translation initiation factor eIF-2B subunit delta [Musca vetustissima]|uniref:translation initiation factor eIF-2B subunit delta n=2 Tax=Musca vetustissima TaxID=27455 RepID=UPI002AB6D094|nr:translation initiation factor eIF-2B subunit delta [Musca vetustissima]